jgi:hypothetical protein
LIVPSPAAENRKEGRKMKEGRRKQEGNKEGRNTGRI